MVTMNFHIVIFVTCEVIGENLKLSQNVTFSKNENYKTKKEQNNKDQIKLELLMIIFIKIVK